MKDYNIMFKHCKLIFYLGRGNFWYENGAVGNENSARYKLYSYSLYLAFVLLVLSQTAAAFFADITEDEKNETLSLVACKVVILFKMFLISRKKDLITSIIRELAQMCVSCEEEHVMKKKYKEIKVVMGCFFTGVTSTFSFFIIQGIVGLFKGLNFVVVLTYYPAPDDFSFLATCLRIVAAALVYMLMLVRIVADTGLAIVIMIILKYKYVTLANYFESLSDVMARDMKEEGVVIAAKNLREGLKEGIFMHNQILRLATGMNEAFSGCMAVQLMETCIPGIHAMLEIALYDYGLVYTLKKIIFTLAVFYILGMYMCIAGEITHQASFLPNAIFYSGWYLCPSMMPVMRQIRPMVVMAVLQAQKPFVIKVFDLVPFTYATYLEIIKSSYSVYTLFRTQK